VQVNPYVVPLPPPAETEKKEKSTPAPFGDHLQEALQKVNSMQLEADEATAGLISGEIEDLHQVMIATEQARLSLQLTVQVTNKIVEAYREISRMQI